MECKTSKQEKKKAWNDKTNKNLNKIFKFKKFKPKFKNKQTFFFKKEKNIMEKKAQSKMVGMRPNI